MFQAKFITPMGLLYFIHSSGTDNLLKGQSYEKFAEIRVWDISLDPNQGQLLVLNFSYRPFDSSEFSKFSFCLVKTCSHLKGTCSSPVSKIGIWRGAICTVYGKLSAGIFDPQYIALLAGFLIEIYMDLALMECYVSGNLIDGILEYGAPTMLLCYSTVH
jgi:hypothetical protein